MTPSGFVTTSFSHIRRGTLKPLAFATKPLISAPLAPFLTADLLRLSRDELGEILRWLDIRAAGSLSSTCHALKSCDESCVWMAGRAWDPHDLLNDAFVECLRRGGGRSESFALLVRIVRAAETHATYDPTLVVLICALGHASVLLELLEAFRHLEQEDAAPDEPCNRWMDRLLDNLDSVPIQLADALFRNLGPAEAAARYGHVECLQLILKESKTLAPRLEVALSLASTRGHAACVQTLLRQRRTTTFDIESRHALCAASSAGHAEIVEMLLAASANPDGANPSTAPSAGSCPLAVSANHGHLSCVQLLVAAGASVNGVSGANRGTPLCEAHDAVIAACLIDAKADVNGSSLRLPPIHSACVRNASDVVRVLVAAGANVNATSNTRARLTPLMFAASSGNDQTVHALLQAQADVNMTSSCGLSALVLASSIGLASVDFEAGHCEKTCARCVQQLVEARADPNLGRCEGLTPLMQAADNGCLEMARTLLEAGADANAVSAVGRSALFLCCDRYNRLVSSVNGERYAEGLAACASLLVDFRADPHILDRDGRTALMLAKTTAKRVGDDRMLRRLVKTRYEWCGCALDVML